LFKPEQKENIITGYINIITTNM